jgi:hypothetical protein
MSIALLGLLGGFAKGASSRIEKEREDNEALIQSRLKMAAINKKKREAEIEARKTVLTERFSSFSPFLDGSENEEDKLALLSNDAIAKDFIDRRSRGEAVDLKQYLVMNKGKIPKTFTSVQQYIDTLSAAPQPVAPEQMEAALGDTRGFLGARTGVSAGRAEKIAGALGAGSAAELLAFERMEPVSAEPLMEMAKINTREFGPIYKTLEEKAQRLLVMIGEAKNEDTKARLQGQLEQTQEAILGHALSTSTKKEDEPKAVATITSSVDRAVRERLETKYGRNIFSEEKVIDLGDGQTYVTRGIRTDVSPEVEQQIMADRRKFAFDALKNNGYLDEDNKPVYQNVNEVMYNLGLRGGLPQRVDVAPPGSAAPAAGRAAPASTQQTRTRAQVEAVAKARNVSYEAAKAAAEAQGIRVVE